MDTKSFIVYIETNSSYMDTATDIETRFDSSNHEYKYLQSHFHSENYKVLIRRSNNFELNRPA